jgi:hypothetical protein
MDAEDNKWALIAPDYESTGSERFPIYFNFEAHADGSRSDNDQDPTGSGF